MSELRKPRAPHPMDATPTAKAITELLRQGVKPPLGRPGVKPGKPLSAAATGPKILPPKPASPVAPKGADGKAVRCEAQVAGGQCKNPGRWPVQHAGASYLICTTHHGATGIRLIEKVAAKKARKPAVRRLKTIEEIGAEGVKVSIGDGPEAVVNF